MESADLIGVLCGFLVSLGAFLSARTAKIKSEAIEQDRKNTKLRRDEDKKNLETRVSLIKMQSDENKKNLETRVSLIEQRLSVVDKLVEKVEKMNDILVSLKTIVETYIVDEYHRKKGD